MKKGIENNDKRYSTLHRFNNSREHGLFAVCLSDRFTPSREFRLTDRELKNENVNN